MKTDRENKKGQIRNSVPYGKRARDFVDGFSARVTKAAGSTGAFISALGLVIVWALAGRIFHYSQNWELVINTGTSVITFLMVFLIQKSQNKDSLAIQLKLNELLAAHEFASNRLVNVESMSEDELKVIQKYYSRLSGMADKESVWRSRSKGAPEDGTELNDVSRELLDMKNELEDRLRDNIERDQEKRK
ncbi:MAG: low affinity iron permease family protein [Puia sp.]|nr:low affinity iron permease family protein [Puia sp.]